MRCDGQQIPEALDGTKARLFRAPATFIGKAAPWNEGSPGAPNQVSYEGRSVAAIGGGRVYGILTPDMAADPSVWFSYPLRGLRVVENGNQGFLKKRPLSVQFGCDSWYVKMSEVFLIIPASGGRQTAGQEGTLLQALKA
jgi:hypothetical protein